MRETLKTSHHWVVKIGSGVLVREGVALDRPVFVALVQSIVGLIEKGHRVTIVSSGAVALGRRSAGGVERPRDLPTLQALAALGQAELIQMFDQELKMYGLRAAQVLLGRRELDIRETYLNTRMTMEALTQLNAVPIVNENDTIATEGLRFDDNDHLASLIVGVTDADILVILSDIPGVLERKEVDGHEVYGERISTIDSNDPYLFQVAGPSQSGLGRGGMVSKIRSAKSAGRYGVHTVIASGKSVGILDAIYDGDDVGTLIVAEAERLSGRKVWLHSSAVCVGTLVVDEGAERALLKRGASLLPSGLLDVEGSFGPGSVVEIRGQSGEEIGRGISIYGSDELSEIRGLKSHQVTERLGFKRLDVIVHRDMLVLT